MGIMGRARRRCACSSAGRSGGCRTRGRQGVKPARRYRFIAATLALHHTIAPPHSCTLASAAVTNTPPTPRPRTTSTTAIPRSCQASATSGATGLGRGQQRHDPNPGRRTHPPPRGERPRATRPHRSGAVSTGRPGRSTSCRMGITCSSDTDTTTKPSGDHQAVLSPILRFMRDVVIVDAVRTPVSRRNGELKDVHSTQLLGAVQRRRGRAARAWTRPRSASWSVGVSARLACRP